MLIKYKHTDFLAASEAEISQINSSADLNALFDTLYEKQGVAGGFGGFEMVFALSRNFFQDEEHIPKEIDIKIPDISKIFQYCRDFIDKIVSFEREEMDLFGYRLREDEFCRKNGFVSMGIWVLLYELHDCCNLAVKEGKNLYLLEENSEYISER